MPVIINEEFDEEEYLKWANSRPPVVKKLALKFRPHILYKIKSSGHYGWVYAISEEGTLTIGISSEFNKGLMFNRTVFGIPPEDLEEATELPKGTPEPVLKTADEIQTYLGMLRDQADESGEPKKH
jgi:hypothetical protein